MLRNISPLITPELLHTLASMGHGDVLAIVDRNYPAARHERLHTAFGVGTTEMARAIFELFPIDDFIAPAAWRMVPDGTRDFRTPTHDAFEHAAGEAEGRPITASVLERAEFYERAASAFAVVHTSESEPFSCFLVVKGVL